MEVVPYQVRIYGYPTEADAADLKRGRDWAELPRALRRRSRRPLALLTVGFGCLAFAAAAHGGIDDSTATMVPDGAPPQAAMPAPAAAAPTPTPDAMTSAATEEGQTLVSPQYQDETAPDPAPVASEEAQTQVDEAPVADAPAEGSNPVQLGTTESAATGVLITHDAEPPNQPAAATDAPPSSEPSPSASTAVTSPARTNWYHYPNSQYQFHSSLRNAVSHLSTKPVLDTSVRRVVNSLQTPSAEKLLTPSVVPPTTASFEPRPVLGSGARVAAQTLLEAQLCRALAGEADTVGTLRADAAGGCRATSPRYHVADPQYRRSPRDGEAVSNVVGRLGKAAQQLALTRTATGSAGAGPSPSPDPANVEATRPTEPTPGAASRSFLPRAAAAVSGTLSRLTPTRPPELSAIAPAARFATGFGASLLPKLAALPGPADFRGRKLAGGHLADTRRLLQIGLALGLAYLVFLMFWFWGTRGRHRGLRGRAGL